MTTPQIDFYCLNSTAPQAVDRLLATICEKAVSRQHRVHIHVQDAEEAQRLDNKLWTIDEMSFLSHTCQANQAEDVPITLSAQQPLTEHRDVLINLHAAIPDFATAFQRIIHLVPADEAQRALSREHFKHYQALGIKVNVHQIT